MCLVFSKDRPLQLDGMLRSLMGNCADLDPTAIRVLYTVSNARYAALYLRLAAEHPGVMFFKERDFKGDLVDLVNGATYVMFAVDDALFVGPLSISQITNVLDADPSCLGFSCRLGRNTTYCYAFDRSQKLPTFVERGGGLLAFEWANQEFDFGYPLELSSSLYRVSDVLPLLMHLDYRDPNTLEAALALSARSLAATRPRLACYERSVAVSVPANVVQTAWLNRAGSDANLAIEALAANFDKGLRLDADRYRGYVARGAHEELEFHLVQNLAGPTVSVVIPCYRQAEFLPDALASVVAQTFADWEIVIVDDGSPDDTEQVAKDFINEHPDRRIRLVRQKNKGLPAARNCGIAASTGRFVLPLDADDRIEPEMLERTVALLESDSSIDIAYTDQQQFGASTGVLRLQEYDPDLLARANFFAYCSLFRRAVWETVGGYSAGMEMGYEDWDFWIRAAAAGFRARRISEALFSYRVKQSSMHTLARLHHAELAAQIRANHPAFFAPVVSILTLTFNHREFIGRCIDSVLAQTDPRWEQIIIDDGSTDGTDQVVRAYSDPRIRYVAREHRGIGHLGDSYNSALEMAQGRLVAILEGDDFWPIDKLERQLSVFKRPGVVLSWGFAGETTAAGDVQRFFPPERVLERMQARPKDALRELLVMNYIPACTVMCDRLALESIGGFQQPPGTPTADYPTWLALTRVGSFAPVSRVLGYWRRHANQVSVLREAEMLRISNVATEFVEHMPKHEREAMRVSTRYARGLANGHQARLDFSAGRAALRQGQSADASRWFMRALRRGGIRTRLQSLVGLACTHLGIDLERVVDLRDRVLARGNRASA